MTSNQARTLGRALTAGALSAAFLAASTAGQGIASAADRPSASTLSASSRLVVHGSLDATKVGVGQVFHLHLKVSPGRSGQAVQWQVLTRSGWVKGGTVRLRSGGTVDVALQGSSPGRVTLRGYAPAARGHRAGASAALHLTVTAATSQPMPPAPPPNAGQPPAPDGGKFP